MAMKDDAKSLSFVEDTAVDPEHLRDYIDRFLQIIRKHQTSAGIYAHASVGCLHVRPVVNMKTEEGVRKFEAIANEISDLVLEFGGALSGEHGDGLVRSPFLRKMFGPILYDAFKTIKQTFDPQNLFNPGKIVDAPPLTSNLRYGANYKTPKPNTFFDYSDYGGMAGAVEMCSGLGACRKKLEGTMCPSYMATREEAHSTRGRANTLRLAMAGKLGESGLGDKGVYDVLDLCLECRACKAECPVGVDVARFKSEFLADYWARHGTPLHAKLLANAHTVARVGSAIAPIANWISDLAPVKAINERFFGIDRRRSLPAWSSQTFTDGVKSRNNTQPDVYLFNDTFTNYYNPEVGIAAWDVLQAAGAKPSLSEQRVLRPSAHLERPPSPSKTTSARQHQSPVRHSQIRPQDSLPRTELSLGSQGRRALTPPRRRTEEGRRSSRGLHALRTIRRRLCNSHSKRDHNKSSITAIAIRSRWDCYNRRKPFYPASPPAP